MSTQPHCNASLLTTEQFAAMLQLKPQSIRKRLCTTGSYFGVRPCRLPNGRLRWQREAAAGLLAGGTK